MRVQLVIAITLSAGLSVARAQAPAAAVPHAKTAAVATAQTKPAGATQAKPAGAQQKFAVAGQPKPAGAGVPPAKPAVGPGHQVSGSPTASKSPAPPLDAEAERNADVQLLTARVYLVDEDLPAPAIGLLTSFLELHPDHFQARLMRGYAHGRLGHHAEAQADYQQALDVMLGTSADEVLLRAQEFAFTKQREIALALIEDGIRRLGPMPNLEAAALRLEINLHRTEDAVVRIKGMLSRAKYKGPLYAKLADIWDEVGRPDLAMDARRQAVMAFDAMPEDQKTSKTKRLRDDLVYRVNRASRGSTW
jgi:tetratricopeptide (TPR) repeat protein